MATETDNLKALAAWLTRAMGNTFQAAFRLERMYGYCMQWKDVDVVEHLDLLDRADRYRRSALDEEWIQRTISELKIPRLLQFDPSTGGFAEELALLTQDIEEARKAFHEAKPLVGRVCHMLPKEITAGDPASYGVRLNKTITETSGLLYVAMLDVAARTSRPVYGKNLDRLQESVFSRFEALDAKGGEVNKFVIDLDASLDLELPDAGESGKPHEPADQLSTQLLDPPCEIGWSAKSLRLQVKLRIGDEPSESTFRLIRDAANKASGGKVPPRTSAHDKFGWDEVEELIQVAAKGPPLWKTCAKAWREMLIECREDTTAPSR